MWLAAALLVAVALALALLAVPLRARVRVDAGTGLEARLRVEWLFGWVTRDVSLPREGERRAGRGRPTLEQISLLVEERFRDEVAGLLRRARRFVEIEELFGWARLGLGDPAETGIAVGMLQPLVVLLASLPGVALRLEPDFESTGLRGELRGSLALVPLGMLAAALRFALAPATLRTFRRFRSLRS